MLKKKIKKLFDTLTNVEQIELLNELSRENGSTRSIDDFSLEHQKEFGMNITFTISQKGLDHEPEVKVIVHTFFGDFVGLGRNKKIAKSHAIEKALKKW